MKIELSVIGKTAFKYLEEGIQIYEKRLKHYARFDIYTIPDVKNIPLSNNALKIKEGESILTHLSNEDVLVLLDEKGKTMTSIELAAFIENQQIQATKKIVFQIGGAFGFSDAVYQRANVQISLSKMTFSHQMVRLLFIEQLYRAFTILKGEKYHNE